MTELITPKKTNQTWTNYILETMKDKGLETTLERDNFHKGEDPDTLEANFRGKYGKCRGEITVTLRYQRDVKKSDNWEDFNNLDLFVCWQMISFSRQDAYHNTDILFHKMHGQDEYINISFAEEKLDDINKIISKVKQEDVMEDDYMTYIIHDNSIGEELIYQLVDYIAQKEKVN